MNISLNSSSGTSAWLWDPVDIAILLQPKVKSESQSRSVVSDSATPWTIQSLEFSRPEYWSEKPFAAPGDLPTPGIESPTLHADSLSAEPPGEPKNTGVGSLSLLQQLFLTQDSNWGPLHCRRILYQTSCQGSLERHQIIWLSDLAINCGHREYGYQGE